MKVPEERWQTLAGTIPAGVIASNKDFYVTRWNKNACRLMGIVEGGEITGRLFMDLLAKDDRERFYRHVSAPYSSTAIPPIVVSVPGDNGTRVPLIIYTSKMSDTRGRHCGYLFLVHSLKERLAAERAHLKRTRFNELDRLKTDLLSTVSHELRTPLASIKGYATMMIDYDERLSAEEKREYLSAIDRATDRLEELINRLLDLSRFNAGLVKLDLAPGQLAPLAEAAVAEARMRAPGYVFSCRSGGEPALAAFDIRRIREVLDNLLDNAVKYSPQGSAITVTTEANDEYITVTVADEGSGIPPGEEDKIFERLYRLKDRGKSDPGGLGLGLTICKSIIEAHGGTIRAETLPEKGSAFTFTLPRYHAAGTEGSH